MNGESLSPQVRSWPIGQVSPGGLAALSGVAFSGCDTGEIFKAATLAVGDLAPSQVEVSYQCEGSASISTAPGEVLRASTLSARRCVGTERAQEYGRLNAGDGMLLVRITPRRWRRTTSPANRNAR
jgi:hypothetical protein